MDIITRKQFTRFADFNFPNYTVKTSCIRDPRNELGLTFFHLLPLFHYFHSFPLKYIPHISLHLLHLYSFTYIEDEKFTTECLAKVWLMFRQCGRPMASFAERYLSKREDHTKQQYQHYGKLECFMFRWDKLKTKKNVGRTLDVCIQTREFTGHTKETRDNRSIHVIQKVM